METADRSGIFAGDDPLAILGEWLAEAETTEPSDANAMTLATVDASGMPDARIVLLKDIRPEGLVFFTNYTSAKGEQLAHAGKAAVNFHWKSLGRQVRARGLVHRADAETSDAYYKLRPFGSRIGAWASQQSRPLASRAALMERVEEFRARYGDDPPRPDHWGGFVLSPLQIEFWAAGEFRLHDSFRWRRRQSKDEWKVTRINP